MADYWIGSIEVSADAHKTPNDPVEAAKLAWDEMRSLTAPVVVVTQWSGGVTRRWEVDLEDGVATEVT